MRLTAPVFMCDATSGEEARELALAAGVECFNNQYLGANFASRCKASERREAYVEAERLAAVKRYWDNVATKKAVEKDVKIIGITRETIVFGIWGYRKPTKPTDADVFVFSKANSKFGTFYFGAAKIEEYWYFVTGHDDSWEVSWSHTWGYESIVDGYLIDKLEESLALWQGK
jgi:hypothetical protein